MMIMFPGYMVINSDNLPPSLSDSGHHDTIDDTIITDWSFLDDDDDDWPTTYRPSPTTNPTPPNNETAYLSIAPPPP